MSERQGLYVIYDRVAKDSSPVFQAINDGIAARQFRNLISKVSQWDRDAYKLYQVGYVEVGGLLIEAINPVEVEVSIPSFDEVKPREFQFEAEGKS